MKNLMTTTALALTLVGGTAMAAEHSGGAFADYQMDPTSELFASDLMGASIYGAEEQSEEGEGSGEGEESESGEGEESGGGEGSESAENDPTANRANLGEINDLIVDGDGSVQAAILGIGGFLGIGERDVAVNMDQLQIMRDGEDPSNFTLVIDATQEEIENAPEFTRPGEEASGEGSGEGESEEDSSASDNSGEGSGSGESSEGNAEEAGSDMENEAESTGEEAASESEQAAEEATSETDQAAEEAESETEGESSN